MKTCNFCGTPNHYSSVRRQKPNDSNDSNDRVEKFSESKDDSAVHIIAHVRYKGDTFTTVSSVKNVHLIKADLKPFPANGNHKPIQIVGPVTA